MKLQLTLVSAKQYYEHNFHVAIVLFTFYLLLHFEMLFFSVVVPKSELGVHAELLYIETWSLIQVLGMIV